MNPIALIERHVEVARSVGAEVVPDGRRLVSPVRQVADYMEERLCTFTPVRGRLGGCQFARAELREQGERNPRRIKRRRK
jgi:hypothetical protein